MNKYYITTTLPYVNSEPHIGFALEIIRADVIARWQRLKGNEVFFNTGVDEHGLKIFRKAEELGISTQAYCDEMAAKFSELKSSLNLSYDNFIRTTDEHHLKAVQEFWRLSLANGDIYKKNYQVKYCVGCELEKTESELVDSHCPDHPNQELETIDEENYFFRFSKYQKDLLKLYQDNPEFVVPNNRLNEISKFVERGLDDFSISRLKEKMPWGVPVPNDEKHVMYVWFDALVNYISCLGWPDNQEKFNSFWPGVQICGKDNLRQQAAMWPAMLLSAGLKPSRQVVIDGFITSGGQKMSKSLGNVINPITIADKYGTDALRYYLLSQMNSFDDSDFTIEKFQAVYQADLANGLGNLAARISNLLEKNEIRITPGIEINPDFFEKIDLKMKGYLFSDIMRELWSMLKNADEKLSADRPWKMEDKEAIKQCLEPLAKDMLLVGRLLTVFMPSTGEKIVSQFNKQQINKAEALFPRLT